MLYAIADLHLSLGVKKKKPMDIFGENWKNHEAKIQKNWSDLIHEADTVLMPGDISWAKTDEEFSHDMAFIKKLPGKKIISCGNHDYWWSSAAKLKEAYPEVDFLKNNFFMYKNYHICGTRGWITPKDSEFTKHDKKIYNREMLRLELSLNAATNDGAKDIILMMHYPPASNKNERSGFMDIIEKYPIRKVVYGHLHSTGFYKAMNSEIDGIKYSLVAADYLDFKPLILIPN